ncbi:MAG: ComF family protein [Clostridia bacterium]|nr:ComF family protein [Clostridia bacterium]
MRFFKELAEKIRKRSSEYGYVCDGCGKEIFNYPTQRLCDGCMQTMRCNDGLKCGKCGRKTVADGVCLDCKSRLPKFTQGISPFVYRGETAAFVNRIKNGKRRLAHFFGESMAAAALRSESLQTAKENNAHVWVLPVPMTEKALKTRGYNQAQDLAEIVCEALRKAGINAETDADILQKHKETAQQKHLNYAGRAENVAGAYHVHKRAVCKEEIIVLVDDIMTTGATGSEIAARLFGAGAKEVIFLVAAALPEHK